MDNQSEMDGRSNAAERKARKLEWLILLCILAGMLAVAIPNFLHYSARPRHLEALAMLNGIFASEQEFYKAHRRYGTLEEIGFRLEPFPTNRYTYRIDRSERPGTIVPAGTGQVTPDNTIVPAGFNATGFTATATGHIDDDPVLDQWHVNDRKQGLGKADVDDATN